MKANRIFVMALVVGLIFAFSNTVLGNGAGRGAKISRFEPDNRLEITGTFEARKYKIGDEYRCIVLADLKWTDENGITSSKKIQLDLPQPISKKQICEYENKDLGNVFATKIRADEFLSQLKIEATNKELVLERVIKTGGECKNKNIENIPFNLQIIYGVISIKVEEIQP